MTNKFGLHSMLFDVELEHRFIVGGEEYVCSVFLLSIMMCSVALHGLKLPQQTKCESPVVR